MEVVKSGRKFLVTFKYQEMKYGFVSTKTEQMILDGSQISIDLSSIIVRRKGRGKGVDEHFASSMVEDMQEI